MLCVAAIKVNVQHQMAVAQIFPWNSVCATDDEERRQLALPATDSQWKRRGEGSSRMRLILFLALFCFLIVFGMRASD